MSAVFEDYLGQQWHKLVCACIASQYIFVRRDQLRRTQSTLEDSGGLKSADIFGNVEEEFTFDALLKKNRISVSALVCSALKGELGDVRAFISRCARL